MDDRTILKITNGNICYNHFPVLEVVDVSFKNSSIYLLQGLNGTGKTSFFRAIIGLKVNFNGNIYFKNKKINYMPTHIRIGNDIRYIPQERRSFKRLNVIDHFDLGENNKSFNLKSRKNLTLIENAKQYINNINRKGWQLSGGEAKLTLLFSLTIDLPKLVILDEPFAGLDNKARKYIINLIETLKKKQCCCIISDHTGTAEKYLHITKTYKLKSNKNIETNSANYKLSV